VHFGSDAGISLCTCCGLIAFCFCCCLEVIFDVVLGTIGGASVTSSGQFWMHFLHFALPSSYHLESLIIHYCFARVSLPSFLFEFDFPWILVL